MDTLNAQFGRETVRPLSTGIRRSGGTRAGRLSPRYTTRIEEIMVATPWRQGKEVGNPVSPFLGTEESSEPYRAARRRGATGGREGFRTSPSSVNSTLAPG